MPSLVSMDGTDNELGVTIPVILPDHSEFATTTSPLSMAAIS